MRPLYNAVRSKDIKSKSDPKDPKSFTDFLDRYWLYELGASLLSLLFFIGIVVILKNFEHQRLSDWPYGFTINTAVSILATALGSTLSVPISEGLGQLKWLWFRSPRTITDIETFDSATRGPIGAFKLLYKLRGLHLGILGSFITIVAFALSPFVQQVITYQIYETALSFNATIPKSNYFDLTGGGYHLDPGVNINTQGAVINGIFNPDTSALQVKPSCKTGNCTFSEPYSSLAVCSSCSNVTRFIEQTIYDSITEGNKTINFYNYTLPNGISISDFRGEYISTIGSANGNNTVWSGFAAPLSVVTVLSSTNDAINDPQDFAIVGPWAAQCVFYLCINTYTSSVANGILKEQTISTYFNESAQPLSSGYNLTQQPCVSDLESGNSTNSTYAVADGISENGEPEYAFYSSCDYFVNPFVLNALSEWMPLVFTAGSPLDFETVIYNNNVNGTQSNFSFVETVMARVAMSLTTNIRTYGSGPPAFGISYTPETYIEVQWNWLILPACLVFFSIFFLAATIVQSRGIEAWKSSSLALLFSSDVIGEQDKIVKLHEIEWIAEGRCAILKDTAAGNIQLSREID